MKFTVVPYVRETVHLGASSPALFKTAQIDSSQNTQYNGNLCIYLITWSKAGKKWELTSFSQCCSYFILSWIDVASRPAALGPQGTECLNQYLNEWTERPGEKSGAIQEQGTNLSKNMVSIPSQQLALHWRVTPKFNSAVWHNVT